MEIKSKFPLGKLRATPKSLFNVNAYDMLVGLRRHASCDWGDICEQDKAANESSFSTQGRLLSEYHDRTGKKFWIITDVDRSATTILLPDEY